MDLTGPLYDTKTHRPFRTVVFDAFFGLKLAIKWTEKVQFTHLLFFHCMKYSVWAPRRGRAERQ